MKKVTKLFLIIAALFVGTSTAWSQNRPDTGTVGLSAAVQTSQTNLRIPIWASDNIVIAPIIGITHQEDNFTSLNLGINPRFYQSLGDNIGTYIGVQGILQQTSVENGGDRSDFLLGATGGGEYFLDEHFSLGVEGQLNFLFEDNGPYSVSTGTALTGTFYF